MAKKLIPTKGLGGIDCRHGRELGKASKGKNFFTRNGALHTRDGNSAFDTTGFDAIMQSLHSISRIGVSAQLLVQKGVKLYHKPSASWVELGSSMVPTGKTLRSCRWIDQLILACGKGDGATGTAVLTGTAVTSITINNGGSRYDAAPTISFSGGGGSAAAAHCHLTNGVVTSVDIDAGGSGYTSAPTVIFTTSDTGAWAYDINKGTITALLPGTDCVVPQMEYVLNWKNRIWGWSPNGTYSSRIYFCGYDEVVTTVISKDHWPLDFFLDISGETGLPILSSIAFQTHLLILTQMGYWRVWGNTEDDFAIQYGGATSVYSADTCVLVNDSAFWLGVEDGKNVVYNYTGTSPVPISQPIDELLADKSLTDVMAFGVYNQYWLCFPNAPAHYTTCYIFDLNEGEWYIAEFPFIITSVAMHGTYGSRKYLHVAIKELSSVAKYYILKMDDSDADAHGIVGEEVAITTNFIYGPFELDSLAFKSRTLWVNAQPRADYDIDFYMKVDGKTERGPIAGAFVAALNSSTGEYDVTTTRIKLKRLKGRNCYVRGTTTDKITDLQKIDLVVSPKSVK